MRRSPAASAMTTEPVVETELRVLADIGETQELAPHRARREGGRVARHEGLARGGGLAAVRRDVGVRGHEIDLVDRRAKRVGANLRDDRVRALTDIDRALEQREPAVRLAGRGAWSRDWTCEVLPQPYHMPATPTPRLKGPRASAL